MSDFPSSDARLIHAVLLDIAGALREILAEIRQRPENRTFPECQVFEGGKDE